MAGRRRDPGFLRRPYCIRLPEGLMARIDAAAVAAERTRTAFMEEAIREALVEWEKETRGGTA